MTERELVHVQYSRPRKYFGKSLQYILADSIDSYRFFPSFTDPNYLEQNEKLEQDVEIQNATTFKTVAIQTQWNRKVNSSSQYHIDDCTNNNNNSTTTNIEQMETVSISPQLFSLLLENEKQSLFQDDFEKLSREELFIVNPSNSQLKETQSFTHVEYSKSKKIASIDWQPKAKGMIAFSCVDPRSLMERLSNLGKTLTSYIIIWNFNDPIYPQIVLEAPFDVSCIKFNPYQPSIIAGGLINGQVCLWDLEMVNFRKIRSFLEQKENIGKETIPHIKWSQISLVESSHRLSVTDIQWIPDGNEYLISDGKLHQSRDKQTYQFFSTACDGKVLLWDIRKDFSAEKKKKKNEFKDVWIPIAKFQYNNSTNRNITLTQISIGNTQGNPYELIAASQDGEFIVSDFTNLTNPNSITILNHHFGNICSLQRNPFFDNLFLTVGDWTFKIWKLGCNKPIWQSPTCENNIYLTCGRWSLTRPGVLYIGREDGQIEVWDFMDKSHNYSMKTSITQSSITSMEFRIGSGVTLKYSFQYMAVGTQNGTLYVIEVPKALIRPQYNELESMQQFFMREAERMQYYSSRWKLHELNKQNKNKQEEREETEQDSLLIKSEDSEVDFTLLKEKFLQLIKKNTEQMEE